jgi:hypothetical protein
MRHARRNGRIQPDGALQQILEAVRGRRCILMLIGEQPQRFSQFAN